MCCVTRGLQGRVLLPVGTSSTSQQTLMCWNTLVGQVMVMVMVYAVCIKALSQAMDATQWTGAGAANALPMQTAVVDARALLDKRDLGHEFV